jgi:hypothetical protein
MTVVFVPFYSNLYFFKSCLLLRPESYTGRIQEVHLNTFIFYAVDEQKLHITLTKDNFLELNIIDTGQFNVFIAGCSLKQKSTPTFAIDTKTILKQADTGST